MRISVPLLSLALAASLLPLGATADVTGHALEKAVFSVAEREVIHEYFSAHPDDLRPAKSHRHGHGHGHGRHGGLPPGIAMNLERGKPLPPGIAKQQLPVELQHRLPPPPKGYERIVVDGKVLLVEIATQVIHDVIADAVLGDSPRRR